MRRRERSWKAPFVVTAAPLVVGGVVALVATCAPLEGARAQPGTDASGLRPLQAGDVVQRDGAGRCFRTPGPCAGDDACGPAVSVPCPLRAAPPRSRLIVEAPGFCLAAFDTTCPPDVPCNPPQPVPVACPGEVTAEQVVFQAVATVPVIGPGNPPGPTPVTPASVPAARPPEPMPRPMLISRNPPANHPRPRIGDAPPKVHGVRPPASAPPSAPATEAERLPEAPPGAQIIRTPEGCEALLPQPPCPPDALCNPPPPMPVRCP